MSPVSFRNMEALSTINYCAAILNFFRGSFGKKHSPKVHAGTPKCLLPRIHLKLSHEVKSMCASFAKTGTPLGVVCALQVMMSLKTLIAENNRSIGQPRSSWGLNEIGEKKTPTLLPAGRLRETLQCRESEQQLEDKA